MQNEPSWIFRQFCDIKEDPGKKKGDTVFYDKVLRLDTKGGTLVETATVPQASYKVVKDSVVVTEWGNSVPWTEKLETLAEFDPQDIGSKMLKSDQLEVIDSAVATQFDTAEFVAVCSDTATTVFTTNGTATVTTTANMSDKNVRDVVDYLEKKWVPKFSDGMYRGIASREHSSVESMIIFKRLHNTRNRSTSTTTRLGCTTKLDLSWITQRRS